MKLVLIFLLCVVPVCAQGVVDEVTYGVGDSLSAMSGLQSAGGKITTTIRGKKSDTGHTMIGVRVFCGGTPDSVMVIFKDGLVFGYKVYYNAAESRKVSAFLRKIGAKHEDKQLQFKDGECRKYGNYRVSYYIIDYCNPKGSTAYSYVFISDTKKLEAPPE